MEEVREDLAAKREIAGDVQVKAPTEKTVDVTVELDVGDGDFSTIKTEAEQMLLGFFSGRLLGLPVRLAELGDKLYHLEGVENYRIVSPAEDMDGDATVLPVLGEMTVTQMGA